MEKLSDKQEHDIVNYGECMMHNKMEKFKILESVEDFEVVNDWYDYHSTTVTAERLSTGDKYSFQYDYIHQNV